MKLHAYRETPPRESHYTRREELVYNGLALIAGLVAVVAICALLLVVWP